MSKTCKNTSANIKWEENFGGTCKVLITAVKSTFKYMWRTQEVGRLKQEWKGGEVLTTTKDLKNAKRKLTTLEPH